MAALVVAVVANHHPVAALVVAVVANNHPVAALVVVCPNLFVGLTAAVAVQERPFHHPSPVELTVALVLGSVELQDHHSQAPPHHIPAELPAAVLAVRTVDEKQSVPICSFSPSPNQFPLDSSAWPLLAVLAAVLAHLLAAGQLAAAGHLDVAEAAPVVRQLVAAGHLAVAEAAPVVCQLVAAGHLAVAEAAPVVCQLVAAGHLAVAEAAPVVCQLVAVEVGHLHVAEAAGAVVASSPVAPMAAVFALANASRLNCFDSFGSKGWTDSMSSSFLAQGVSGLF